MTKTVDKVKNSYTYYLKKNLAKLYFESFESDDVSVNQLKKNVFNYTFDAPLGYKNSDGQIIYTKKKQFLDNVKAMTDKESIYFYCLNSVKKAEKTEAHTRIKEAR